MSFLVFEYNSQNDKLKVFTVIEDYRPYVARCVGFKHEYAVDDGVCACQKGPRLFSVRDRLEPEPAQPKSVEGIDPRLPAPSMHPSLFRNPEFESPSIHAPSRTDATLERLRDLQKRKGD